MKVNTSVYEFCKYIAVIPQIIIFIQIKFVQFCFTYTISHFLFQPVKKEVSIGEKLHYNFFFNLL